MGKSVYSIVLDDRVIYSIDALAARNGTSRSNLINRILAEHLGYVTNENVIGSIYDSMDKYLSNNTSLILQALGSSSLINMRSSIKYKYKPIIRYSLEIIEDREYIGKLKVSLRSQNSDLLNIIDAFFNVWTNLEIRYAGLKSGEYSIGEGRYLRLLKAGPGIDYSNYGRSIAGYIDFFDKCLNDFFSLYPVSRETATIETERKYINYIHSNK